MGNSKMTIYAVAVAVVALIIAGSGVVYVYTNLAQLSTDIASINAELESITDIVAPEGMELLKAAKEEGTLVAYMVVPSEPLAKLVSKFNEKYPWLDVQWVRGGTYPMTEKVTAEIESGNLKADIFSVNDVDVFRDFKEKGWLLEYNSSHYADYPDTAKDPGYWAAFRAFTYPVTYNTEKISTPPTSWEDLLKPEYKGHVCIEDPRTAGDALVFYWAMKEKYGIEFWQTMAEQDVLIEYSCTPTAEKIATGEMWIGYTVDYRVLQWRDDQGAPIDGIWPEEGTTCVTNPLAILAQCPHPNAAKLFLDWCLSYEGQSYVVNEMKIVSTRNGMPSPAGFPSEITLVDIDWDEIGRTREELLAEFEEIMHLG